MYRAPHEVRDIEKLEGMVEFLSNGGNLPPIIVCGEIAFTGSHRLAAWEQCGFDANVVEIDDDDIAKAMIEMGLDPEYDGIEDFNEFCESLFAVTEYDDIKQALADQF